MSNLTLIDTFMHLLFIGGLLFTGFVGGNALVEYIEYKAKQAAKREPQNKEGSDQ